MKLMLRAAVAVFTMGIASAYANEGGTAANTWFTQLPGVVAQAPVHAVPPVATARNGQALQAYVTQTNHGTWFQGSHGEGGSNS